MAEKIMTLSLGGVERTLDFETFWFTKHSQKLLKEPDLTDAERLEVYIISAIKAWYSKERKKEDFTIEDVKGWLGDMKSIEIAQLEKRVVEIILSDVPGEVPAPEGA